MRRFLALISLVASVECTLVSCEEPDVTGEHPAGKNTMHYNSSTTDVAASFCQADEDTVVLFFSPAEVTFENLDRADYYIKVTLDAATLDSGALDVGKGEALVEIIDIKNSRQRAALHGTVNAEIESWQDEQVACDISLAVSFADEDCSAAVMFEGEAKWCGDVEYQNKWTYLHNKVGPLDSKIWTIFIDAREMNFWTLYLSPVTNITFEDVAEFSPVKISIPVDFPLDGTKVGISKESSIVIEYMSQRWDYTNAPTGSIRIDYQSSSGIMSLHFTTNGELRGDYTGPISIIE